MASVSCISTRTTTYFDRLLRQFIPFPNLSTGFGGKGIRIDSWPLSSGWNWKSSSGADSFKRASVCKQYPENIDITCRRFLSFFRSSYCTFWVMKWWINLARFCKTCCNTRLLFGCSAFGGGRNIIVPNMVASTFDSRPLWVEWTKSSFKNSIR